MSSGSKVKADFVFDLAGAEVEAGQNLNERD